MKAEGTDFVAVVATGFDCVAEHSDLGATAELEAEFAGSVVEGYDFDFVAEDTDIVADGTNVVAEGFKFVAKALILIRFKAQVTIQNIKYVRQTVWQGPTEKENASSPILYSQED